MSECKHIEINKWKENYKLQTGRPITGLLHCKDCDKSIDIETMQPSTPEKWRERREQIRKSTGVQD